MTENLEITSATSTEEERDTTRLEPNRTSVMVVEDDPLAREGLCEMLELWGYQAIPVSSAEEAEHAMKRKTFSAAIVDVYLPGRSGATLMSRIREKFPEAVVIGTSGLSDASMARRCKTQGADTFLGKPISLEELAAALQAKHQAWH